MTQQIKTRHALIIEDDETVIRLIMNSLVEESLIPAFTDSAFAQTMCRAQSEPIQIPMGPHSLHLAVDCSKALKVIDNHPIGLVWVDHYLGRYDTSVDAVKKLVDFYPRPCLFLASLNKEAQLQDLHNALGEKGFNGCRALYIGKTGADTFAGRIDSFLNGRYDARANNPYPPHPKKPALG